MEKPNQNLELIQQRLTELSCKFSDSMFPISSKDLPLLVFVLSIYYESCLKEMNKNQLELLYAIMQVFRTETSSERISKNMSLPGNSVVISKETMEALKKFDAEMEGKNGTDEV